MIVWRVIIIFFILSLSFNVDAKEKKHKVVHKTQVHKTQVRKTTTTKKTVKTKVRKKPAIVYARSIYGTPSLIAEINRIVADINDNASVGINIKSMKYGDTLYTRNNYHLFSPASIIKILTAEAALLYLGPEYKYPTTLLTDAKNTNNGIINGNLYLVQSGDPSLTYYDLTDLMVTLKQQDVQGVTGNVYIDTTAYDQENYGPGWLAKDKQYCWAAPINASIINRNCITFKLAPASAPGQLAVIVPNPRYYYGFIQNSVMTKPSGTRSCSVQMNNSEDSLAIDGCLSKGRSPWETTVVVANIMDYNISLMENLFKRYGIQVRGKVDAGEARKNLSTIAVHHSKPLHLLVNEMLKKSDNIIAGSLLKKMGEFYSRQPGGWENGGHAIKQILAKKASLDPSDLIIIDGSGLSLENRIKPAQMMQVLDFAYHHYGTNYEFISALPIAGRDGTLKNRLRNVSRKVRAKTGTLAGSGIVALAGYAVSKDKEPIAFVIMVNGHSSNTWQYREMEDRIVTALTNYSRGS